MLHALPPRSSCRALRGMVHPGLVVRRMATHLQAAHAVARQRPRSLQRGVAAAPEDHPLLQILIPAVPALRAWLSTMQAVQRLRHESRLQGQQACMLGQLHITRYLKARRIWVSCCAVLSHRQSPAHRISSAARRACSQSSSGGFHAWCCALVCSCCRSRSCQANTHAVSHSAP